MVISTLLLTSCGQEWQFHIATDNLVVKNGNFILLLTFWSSGNFTATDIKFSGIAISHCYWHLVVKNGNFTLLTSCWLTSTDIVGRWTISHCYWHLLVKNCNFTLLRTSSGQEWIPISHLLLTSSGQEWTISHCYWHLVEKMDNFTLLLTSSGRIWQFDIGTDI